jgi:hypothetical protein
MPRRFLLIRMPFLLAQWRPPIRTLSHLQPIRTLSHLPPIRMPLPPPPIRTQSLVPLIQMLLPQRPPIQTQPLIPLDQTRRFLPLVKRGGSSGDPNAAPVALPLRKLLRLNMKR